MNIFEELNSVDKKMKDDLDELAIRRKELEKRKKEEEIKKEKEEKVKRKNKRCWFCRYDEVSNCNS